MKIDHAVMGAVVWVLAAAIRLTAQTYTFDPPGSTSTNPFSINASGAIAGYYTDHSDVSHGFVRDPQGNITSFDPTGSVATYPYSINDSAAIAGYYRDASNVSHGFVRDPQGDITSFDPPGSAQTVAYSINTSGAITGYYLSAGFVGHGFVRDPQGNITSFAPPGSTGAVGYSINTSGAITGIYSNTHGFIRDPQGNLTSFDPPGSRQTFPCSINTSGAITGYYIDVHGVSHGFVRDPQGNMTSFDTLATGYTYPSGINASGAIVGLYYFYLNGPSESFVRDPQGNLTPFNYGSVAYGINARGSITGVTCIVSCTPVGFAGTVPNGMDISASTTPTPVPDSAWQIAEGAGVHIVMVQAWDGVSKNKLAHGQLTGAQSNFLYTGAHVLLTYFSNLNAQDQVAAAAQAVGSAITKLKFMAVEVKACCGEFVSWKASTSYVAGARIMDTDNHIQKVTSAGTSGAQAPVWNDTGGTTSDGAVTWQDTGNVVVNQAQRIGYISDAVAYINTQYPSLKVAIFTSNGDWQTITGNCGTSGTNACPALIALPLWDVEHKEFTGGDGNKHLGDGVAGLVPWKSWGATTWQTRDGNQYDWGLCTSAALPLAENPDPEARPAAATCGKESFFGLSGVNLDYFNPSSFQ